MIHDKRGKLEFTLSISRFIRPMNVLSAHTSLCRSSSLRHPHPHPLPKTERFRVFANRVFAILARHLIKRYANSETFPRVIREELIDGREQFLQST